MTLHDGEHDLEHHGEHQGEHDGAAVPDEVGELVCSARGCREPARWGLLWNNPRLHTPTRRKVWLACGDHRESLSQYLQVRAFLRDVVPVAELVRVDPGGPTP